jgi:hypothetical protein
MEILTINLAANETKNFRKAGSYVEILSSSGPIGITMNSVAGGQINSINGGLSGLFLNADFGAFTVADQSGTAQQVLLLTCDPGEVGGSRRQPGNVRVIDEFTNALQTYIYTPATAVQAYNSVAVVAPAANLNGIIVRWSGVNAQAGAGGVANVQFVAAKSTPTDYIVPVQRYPFAQAYDKAGVLVNSTAFFNKFIPAGWGLYASAQVTVATALSLGGQIGYELQ